MRRDEWAAAEALEQRIEARLGGARLLTERVMADVRDLAAIAREEIVAAERAWMAVEAQDDEEA
jgi:hypothetical protein